MGYETHTTPTARGDKSWDACAYLHFLPVAQTHAGCSSHRLARPPEPLQPNVIQGLNKDNSLTVVVIASHEFSEEGARWRFWQCVVWRSDICPATVNAALTSNTLRTLPSIH